MLFCKVTSRWMERYFSKLMAHTVSLTMSCKVTTALISCLTQLHCVYYLTDDSQCAKELKSCIEGDFSLMRSVDVRGCEILGR